MSRLTHLVNRHLPTFSPRSLCNLYNWRYKHLGNLPHVQELPEFQVPNPGLSFDFQLVNVEDFNGVGESEPNPYFYQVSDSLKDTTCENINPLSSHTLKLTSAPTKQLQM